MATEVLQAGQRVILRDPHPLAGKRGTISRLRPGYPGVIVCVSLDRGGSAWARLELVKPDPYLPPAGA